MSQLRFVLRDGKRILQERHTHTLGYSWDDVPLCDELTGQLVDINQKESKESNSTKYAYVVYEIWESGIRLNFTASTFKVTDGCLLYRVTESIKEYHITSETQIYKIIFLTEISAKDYEMFQMGNKE